MCESLGRYSSGMMGRPEYVVWDIKNLAERHDWDYIKTHWRDYGRMISFRRSGVRINIFLRTGTVATCLEHDRKGRTQLFRRNISTKAKLGNILVNPRVHTGEGYYRRKYKRVVSSSDYSNTSDSDY